MHGSKPSRDSGQATGRHSSIATRLLWSYLLLAILPLLIIGGLLIYSSYATQRASVYGEQRNLANRTARDVARYLGDLAQEFAAFEAIVRPTTTIEDWRAQALELAEQTYPSVQSFAVLDLNGQEQLRVEQLQAVPDGELTEYSADPAFRQVVAQNTSLFTPLPATNGSNAILLTLPLRNDAGTLFGVMRATVDAAPIAEELRGITAGTNSTAYVVQSISGELVLSDGKPSFQLPTDRDSMRSAAGTAREYEGARNQWVVGAASPVTLANGVSTSWSVVVEQPADVAFGDLRRNLWLLALVLVLAASLALGWALRQARLLTGPLTALRRGATIVGDGHLDHRIQAGSNDELGDLATAFNQMAAHLQQSLDQIERQNERLRHGLALARDIQLGLLPDRAPWGSDEIAVFARSIPAYEVGGDFYTYIALSEGRAAIAIGDISGKGVGAALLMSLTSSAVESHGRELEHPAEVLQSLNTMLAPRLKANHMNAALMFAVFDPRERLLRVANAGMVAPVLITVSGSRFLDVGGLPIGAISSAVYFDLSVELQPGDTLLLLSDGVVEAHNERGEMFGFDRLEQMLTDYGPGGDVRALVELVLSQVQDFIGGAEQHDDITLVAVRPTLAFDDSVFVEQETAEYATV